ncbi:DUF3153 domain-containing protein [Candidatus Synechococcus calcipolaris G9]|uniref:DUF3153 domain-containing protein n=1 Tax=Candidatus Synechococcus calcipolaris G9 TaxID=1497997 RepID=A0ABT6F1C4_9SYNE|nr:DUF3153 domain-containing protein [Candidatus Synechococcus calcipolaris]MDG2991634.1 DUF3153 domain-containing protein [Candidatus Synechococcus calcipolaris G9]
MALSRRYFLQNFLELYHSQLQRLKGGFLCALLALCLGLTGCIQSDIDIHYRGQSGGDVSQHLQLARPNPALLNQLERQVKQLGGKVENHRPTELDLSLPFDTSQDLAQKLNRLFQPLGTLPAAPLNLDSTHLTIQDQNLLLFLRQHFTYDIDLRPLGVQSGQGEVLVNPETLVQFRLSLETPWGGRFIQKAALVTNDTVVNPGASKTATHRLLWTLQPGYNNHLEAAFIYPSPVGWGALAIGLLVWGGWRLKARNP